MTRSSNTPAATPQNLSREQTLQLLTTPEEARAIKGAFLSFLMIPVIERCGQWRFAGAASDLHGALENIVSLVAKLTPPEETRPPLEVVSQMIADEIICFDDPEDEEDECEGWSLSELKERFPQLGQLSVVLLGEGQAPYDDLGLCIVAVEDLTNHPYATKPAESTPPRAWSGGDYEQDLDEPPFGAGE